MIRGQGGENVPGSEEMDVTGFMEMAQKFR